jgi:hypothetical protein
MQIWHMRIKTRKCISYLNYYKGKFHLSQLSLTTLSLCAVILCHHLQGSYGFGNYQLQAGLAVTPRFSRSNL